MKQFKSLSPDTEIRGQLILAFVYCSESSHIRPFLEAHGLSDVQPNQWYLEQPWLDVLNDITSSGSAAMFDFVSIGMKMADLVALPEEAKSLSFEDAMIAWAAAADSENNYRGANYGWRKAESVGPGHVKVSFQYASPDDVMYGFVYGYCRRLLPPGTRFTVKYDETAPRCDQGGESTTIHVTYH